MEALQAEKERMQSEGAVARRAAADELLRLRAEVRQARADAERAQAASRASEERATAAEVAAEGALLGA